MNPAEVKKTLFTKQAVDSYCREIDRRLKKLALQIGKRYLG